MSGAFHCSDRKDEFAPSIRDADAPKHQHRKQSTLRGETQNPEEKPFQIGDAKKRGGIFPMVLHEELGCFRKCE